MSTVRDEIAKNLLFYRKKAGLTQKELAEKLGVKNTAVSNWESGNNSIDIETLFNACRIFGVSVNDMYGIYSNINEKPAANIGSGHDKAYSLLNLLPDRDLQEVLDFAQYKLSKTKAPRDLSLPSDQEG